MKLTCPACKQKLETPDLPPPSFTNLPSCSVIVFEHPKPFSCLCGAMLAPVVVRVDQIGLAAREVQAPQPSPIVIPGRSH